MIELIAKPHPLRSDAYTCAVALGTKLADLLPDAPETVHAQVNGELWPRERWAEPLPPGHVLVFSTPQDDVGRTLGLIVVAVAAAYAGPAAAGAMGFTQGTLAYTTVSAGVAAATTVAGSLAVNALIPPKLPETPEGVSSTVRKSITGTRNQANHYGVIPRVYGAPRWFPPLAGNPVTEIAGNDQYLRMLLCLGYGPLDIDGHTVGEGYPLLDNSTTLTTGTIRIGETDISLYDDVEWEIGTVDDLTLYTQDIVEENPGVNWQLEWDDRGADAQIVHHDGWTATRTTATDTREISVDITFPAGFFTIDGKGRFDRGTLAPWSDFTIEYREVGASEWTYVPGKSFFSDPIYHRVMGAEKSTVRKSIRWKVPVGQYEVRLTRAHTFMNDFEAYSVDSSWTALRSVQDSDGPYTGNHVLMALRIRASDQLNGVIDQLNVKTQSVLRVWDGAAFTTEATANPAWAYLDALTGEQIARPADDSRIDLDGLKEWADWCDLQGLEYHWTHDGAETVLDRLRSIAAAGQASFALQDGKYGVVRDDPDAPVLQVISPRNAWGMESVRQYRDLPHGLRVKYIDPDTWSDAERTIYRDGYDETTATAFEDLQTQGVASADEAWHHGQYHFRQAILRPETFKVQMDWENLALMRGNRARLAYDSIMVGLGWGRVKAITEDSSGDAQAVTLDERVPMEAGTTYGARIRKQDGEQATVELVTDTAGETAELTFAAPVAGVSVGDLALYGELDRESIDVKVTRIEPGSDFTATLTMVDAATDIYDYDSPPEYDPGITQPLPIDQITPPVPVITSARGDETALVRDTDGSLRTAVRIAYIFGVRVTLPAMQVEARWRRTDEDSQWHRVGPYSASGELHITDVEVDDEIDVQVRSIHMSQASAWSDSETITVTGKTNPPSDVSRFRVQQNGPVVVFRWAQVDDIDLDGYRIRLAKAGEGSWTDSQLVTDLVTGTVTSEGSIPPGTYDFYIKAVDTSGNESVNATVYRNVRVISDYDEIIRAEQAPDWSGLLDGYVKHGDVLVPRSQSTASDLGWEVFDSFVPDPVPESVYITPEIDSDFNDLVRVWAEYDFTPGPGESGEPAAELEIATRLTDGYHSGAEESEDYGLVTATVDESEDYDLVTADTDETDHFGYIPETEIWNIGNEETRYVTQLLRVENVAGSVAYLTSFEAVVDLQERTERHSDVVIAPGGTLVEFDHPFHRTPYIAATAQGNTARYITRDNPGPESVTFHVWDGSGNDVGGTIDFEAKGV